MDLFRYTLRVFCAWLIFFFILPANAFSAATSLSDLGDRSWRKLDSGSVKPVGMLAFSGMTYDSVNHQILLFGGGHNDYWGNEIYAFDLSTLTWRLMYEPDPNPSTLSSANFDNDRYPGAVFYPAGEPVEDARPTSRHTYDSVTFIESIGELFTLGKFTWGSGGDAWSWGPQDTWTYNFKTNKWTYRNLSRQAQPNGETAPAVYDAISELVYSIDAGGVTWTYDHRSDIWRQISARGESPSGIETSLTYDSKRRCLYFFGSEYPNTNTVYKFDIATNTWSSVQATGDIPPAGGGYGVVYDEVSDALHIYQGSGTTLYTFEIDEGRWYKGPEGPIASTNRIHGNFNYDPVNNVSILVIPNNDTVETWAYRHRSGAGQPRDTIAPADPSDLRAE